MKKLLFLYGLLFTVVSSYSQALNAKIKYQATLNSDEFYARFIKDSLISDNLKKLYTEDISNSVPDVFYLLIKGNEALYKAQFDPEKRVNLGHKPNWTNNIAQYENVYYTNTNTNENFFKSFWTRGVVVNLNEVKWTLTEETKIIGGYTSYKAISTIESEQLYGMNYMSPVVAWYTPEIATSFGIKEFNGLPGLILELITDHEYGKVIYKVTDIDLNPKGEIIIERPKGKREMSFKEYLEYIKKLNERR
ncbi:GLPGLI family protein [Maribacter sp. IgM3_T14_3]|uniref:GLPGLI family protein n=1 Tax=Maribacter sp. IgM3_T14_3 TaxID=3415140 RepID=UPI003C6EA875